MKKYIIAVLLSLFSMLAQADWNLQVHGFSKHATERSVGAWNENNYGLGLRKDFNSDFSVQVGTYKNSDWRRTNYAIAEWHPLNYKGFSAGAFAGYGSGYTFTKIVGGALVRYSFLDYNVTVRAVPKVNKEGSAVVAIEAGVKF